MSRPNFDRLAPWYQTLEYIAFGRDLERARFCHLPVLTGSRRILVLGEGDGRCLVRMARLAPLARIDCVELSPAMRARAARRLGDPDRVNFIAADAFSVALPGDRYDALVTHFFLDCFTAEEAGELIGRIEPSLRPEARWLVAEFAVPDRPWPRARARLWLAALYAFFRWQAGLSARALPDWEGLVRQRGWRVESGRDFRGGLIRSVVLGRAAPP